MTKASIFKDAFRFTQTYLSPLQLPFVLVLR